MFFNFFKTHKYFSSHSWEFGNRNVAKAKGNHLNAHFVKKLLFLHRNKLKISFPYVVYTKTFRQLSLVVSEWIAIRSYTTRLRCLIAQWQASLPVKWRPTVIGWEALPAVHYFPVMDRRPLRKNKRIHFKTKQQNWFKIWKL